MENQQVSTNDEKTTESVASQETKLRLIHTPGEAMANTVIGKNSAQLSEILMRSIKNVEENPGYIPQAIAIKDAVGEMIKLAKTEVAMMVTINNLKGSN